MKHRLVKGAYIVNVNHIHYYKYLCQYTVSKWRYSHRFCSYWKSSIYFGETFKKATIQHYIQSPQSMWGSIKIKPLPKQNKIKIKQPFPGIHCSSDICTVVEQAGSEQNSREAGSHCMTTVTTLNQKCNVAVGQSPPYFNPLCVFFLNY